MTKRIGFVGLGDMGRPMATCLARAGADPLLWARNPRSADEVLAVGGALAPDIDTLCAQSHTIFVMLANGPALDEVFGRGTPAFATRLKDRTLVQTGTVPPGHSRALAAEIVAIGGRYVELPVSGSTGPAAQGQLIGMAAGDPAEIDRVAELAAPMMTKVIRCGTVPKALQMKLANNTYLLGIMGGLIEAFEFARASNLDLETFRQVLEAGPLDNPLMRMKIPKLIADDHAPQGSIRQCVNNIHMISEAGADLNTPLPVVSALRTLFEAGLADGLGDQDMTGITTLMRAQSSA